jgi:hypothetical protein
MVLSCVFTPIQPARASSRDSLAATMKRWALILIAFVIPLQLAAAAACAYCEHDTAANTVHQTWHQPTQQEADAAGAGEPWSGEAMDCPLCKTAGSPVLFCIGLDVRHDAVCFAPLHAPPPYHPSHVESIERVPLVHAASF